MELWIRNQDKENLIKVDALEICEECNNNENFVYEVITFYRDKNVVLGDYKTKERALEVLDEIQNLLQPKIKYIQEEPIESIVDFGYQITQNVDMKIQEINRIVYEMPRE